MDGVSEEHLENILVSQVAADDRGAMIVVTSTVPTMTEVILARRTLAEWAANPIHLRRFIWPTIKEGFYSVALPQPYSLPVNKVPPAYQGLPLTR